MGKKFLTLQPLFIFSAADTHAPDALRYSI